LAKEKVRFVHGDVLDFQCLLEAMRQVQLVYHLAAQSTVMGAKADPLYSFTTNAIGTFNVLKAAQLAGVKRLVFTSSREVYGEPQRLPVSEEAPLRAKNFYGASKIAAEAFCHVASNDGLDVVVLRLSNIYGPRDSGRVVPTFITRALKGEPLLLFGGEQILDFLWIHDAIRVLVQVALNDSGISEPVNIGSGKGTPLHYLAERVLEATGSSSEIRLMPARDGETVRFVADIKRAKSLFGLAVEGDPLAHLEAVRVWVEQNQSLSAEVH
jgi:UDP-glucose 4-epimerase